MKILLVLVLASLSSLSMAQGLCDLSANDEAVFDVSTRFDNGEMRGEDHAIALKELSIERLDMISACLKKDRTLGITKEELKDLISLLKDRLAEFVADMNESIQISIDNDRIGMATQLRIERDMEVAEVNLFISKIEKLRRGEASL